MESDIGGKTAVVTSTVPAGPEVRIARDGNEYTFAEFVAHYGEERGAWRWEEAGASAANTSAEAVVALAGGDGPPVVNDPPARAAEAMDEELQAVLEGLAADLRCRMESFAAERQAGSRLKLPPGLRPKQRKAVHLWAEAQGLHHRSFGWANRRRLHLTISGDRSEREVQQEEEFDWAAWAEPEEEVGEREAEAEDEGW